MKGESYRKFIQVEYAVTHHINIFSFLGKSLFTCYYFKEIFKKIIKKKLKN